MKSHVDNMSQEMKLLSNNMDIIDKCSTKLDNTISERREKIEKLSSIHRLLKKVFIFFIEKNNFNFFSFNS